MAELNHLVIYPTLNCNLNCSYCHYYSSKKSRPHKEKIKEKVKLFMNFPYKNKKITFLGGEPLLCFDFLAELLVLIRNKDKKIPISVFTNGTLLDKEKIVFFQEKKVKIVLSIDGRKKDNDVFRKSIFSNYSVFRKIFENIKDFGRDNFVINMTVLPQTAKNLSKNISFLYKLGFSSIGWSLDFASNWQSKQIGELKREILKLKLEYLKMLKNRQRVYEFSNCYEVINGLADTDKILSCSNLILLPDGEFYFCDKIVLASDQVLKKFRFGIDKNGKVSSEREKFFREMFKKGIIPGQLFCPVGIYIYFRFVENLAGKRLKNSVNKAISLLHIVQEEKKKLISDLIKYPSFRKVHNL